jgi:hypothetical protein
VEVSRYKSLNPGFFLCPELLPIGYNIAENRCFDNPAKPFHAENAEITRSQAGL